MTVVVHNKGVGGGYIVVVEYQVVCFASNNINSTNIDNDDN
jgi:hypothetical protein